MKIARTFTAALALAFDFALGASFSNPLKEFNGSDPFIVYSDGFYYLMTTTWTNIQVTRSATLEGLKSGETKVVWEDPDPSRCCNVWAPEVHWLDNKWWIYYASSAEGDTANQRMHVLEGGATPFDPYSYAGQLFDEWAIDLSVIRIADANYFAYSCFRSEIQSLCIAPMNTPASAGTPSLLSQPTEDWEKFGSFAVNEGPVGLYHDGDTYIVYSGSNCWEPEYQLGYLKYDGAGDPLLASSWAKTGPVFSSANGNYGTGHNGFFTSPDGTETWNVYHATTIQTGSCDGNRYTAAQKVNWNADGSPDFGEAAALGTVLDGPSGEPSS